MYALGILAKLESRVESLLMELNFLRLVTKKDNNKPDNPTLETIKA